VLEASAKRSCLALAAALSAVQVLGEHFLNAEPAEHEPAAAPAVAEEVRLWQVATTAGSAEAYRRYLEEYPAGLFQAIAAERMQGLEAAAAVDAEPASVPAGSSLDGVSAALATLGFLSPARAAQKDEIDTAYRSFVRQVGRAGGFDGLYLDAT